jgi:hypothetical protein
MLNSSGTNKNIVFSNRYKWSPSQSLVFIGIGHVSQPRTSGGEVEWKRQI